MDNNISFSKIVSTPTLNAWSQAYNAGKLFAVISLEKTQELHQHLESLNMLGRNLLERLEQEFFTIENKNLESIKKAIVNTFEGQIEGINFSFASSAFINNVLYLFVLGKGRVFIKRHGNFGLVLDSSNDSKDIVSSSGFLKNNDLIILATDAFSKVIANDDLNSALNDSLPSEISESLAPKIHKAEDGRIAAIIIKYGKTQITERVGETEEALQRPGNERQAAEVAQKPPSFLSKSTTFPHGNYQKVLNKYLSLLKSKLKRPNFRVNHKRKVFLSIAIIIVGVLIFSIYLSIQKQNNARVQALFSQIYPEALKKYDEGRSLLDLNKNLARDSFLSAQKILKDNKDKFPQKSKESTTIQDFLKRVDDAIILSSAINRVAAHEVSKDTSSILNTQLNNIPPSGGSNFFTQDSNNIYFANINSVVSIETKTKKSKEIIKNDSIWKNVGGIGIYSGNVYVLDPTDRSGQIFKFVPSEDGYVKGNYFAQDVSPDLSTVKGMAIDGSIYVLLADGTIEKFTKGKRDSFTVSSLDKPFSAPSIIFTNLDTNNIYILDNGNSRIVIVDKKGVYKSQYQSDVLKLAKDFEVKEEDKKIFILSGGKIWEISIK